MSSPDRDEIGVEYSFAPSCSDGYVVRVNGVSSPQVYAYVERLIWIQPDADQTQTHSAVAYPRVIVTAADAKLLNDLMHRTYFPATRRCTAQVFDGNYCRLSVHSMGVRRNN